MIKTKVNIKIAFLSQEFEISLSRTVMEELRNGGDIKVGQGAEGFGCCFDRKWGRY